MGDVQLVTTRISKTSLTQGRGSPSQDPPAFTLPPRNARVSLGGTARLDGKVWISRSPLPPLKIPFYPPDVVLVISVSFQPAPACEFCMLHHFHCVRSGEVLKRTCYSWVKA